MKPVRLAVALSVLAVGLLASGCALEASRPAPVEPETIVKPMADYRQEAAREIAVDEAEAELDRLTREIEADISAER